MDTPVPTDGPARETAPLTPERRLLELVRSGRLAAHYPEVRGLLSELSGEGLTRAGQLLGRLDPDEVLREHPAVPAVTVAVTGHGTLSSLVAPLTAEFARHGLLLRPHVADYNSFVFDLSDPGSALYAAAPELVLCVLDPALVFDEVPTPWHVADVERVLDEKIRLLEGLAAAFGTTSRGTLLLNTLPLLRRHTAQLVDYRSRAALGAVWRDANARLLRLAEGHPSLVVLDLDPLAAEGDLVSDARLSVYAKSHFSPALLAAYAREAGHLGRQLTGRTKKTLVLDLDNTLWGGVLGDDGPDGIEVGGSYRGEAFLAFQRVAKQLGSQGVLLAAASKNDLEPVRAVIREHPDMVLREDDFVRITANWRPKSDNLRDLAEALNLGVDSFVFADDSPYECGLVCQELPEVAVVRLDDEPALHVERLLRDGWFDTRELTAEDRSRPAKYREESARSDFLHSFSSLEDYLRELDVRVTFTPVEERDVPRVSQITLRTNQFNLTTERLQPQDVRDRITDPGTWALAIRSTDRFGDNGLVGAVFVRRDGDTAQVENFLLSCRVFSRGIEQACLSALLRHARDTGLKAVYGSYRPTAKNTTVKDLYPRYGFQPAADDGTTTTYRHDLADIVPPPEHIRLTAHPEGQAL
ncbi:HAD-IIIC family phosphatase [Kitasatospora sp. NPDC058032]|uniref:HAD-IIIC family phosphatase n=1 Tax=Kitasatospora sp. NPDC058032 TaxID=3346307 RepID=UPI0036DE4E07